MVCLYELMRVPKTASPGELRKAYYALARKVHPDKCPDDAGAKESFLACTLSASSNFSTAHSVHIRTLRRINTFPESVRSRRDLTVALGAVEGRSDPSLYYATIYVNLKRSETRVRRAERTHTARRPRLASKFHFFLHSYLRLLVSRALLLATVSKK